MPRQHIHHRRTAYRFPEDFPERLRREKEESKLPWAEIARRIGTHPFTVKRWREAMSRPNAQHLMALQDLADGLGHLLTDERGGR